MTAKVKRYLALGKQIDSNYEKELKFESGANYDPIRRDLWSKKKDEAIKKQNALNMSEEDMEYVNDYYGCYQA